MATREILFDDLNGTPATAENVQTTQFGLDDKWYLIDVTEKNRKLLEEALKPFLRVARLATDDDLADPVSLLDDEGAFDDEDDEADGDEEEAPAERTDQDLTNADRRIIHAWKAEQTGDTKKKYGFVSRKLLAEYDAAHAR